MVHPWTKNCIKTLFNLIFILMPSLASCQIFDLIITENNDSIACKIIRTTEDKIFFKAWMNGTKTSTNIPKRSVSRYEYKAIKNGSFVRTPGTLYIHAGDPEITALHKNSIYASLGIIDLGLNYERLIWAKPGASFPYIWFKIGGGFMAIPMALEGPVVSSTCNLLTGQDNHHFEISIGFGAIFNTYWEREWHGLPAGGLGYRYQNPNTGFLFRAGIGSPEILYMSIGKSF